MDTQALLPPEYQTQIDEANRRRALAQVLQKRAMTGTQVQNYGPQAARLSPFAVLGDLGAGALGLKMENDAVQSAGDTQKQYRTDATKAIADWQNLPEDAQISASQTSQFPMVQALGKALQDRKTKRLELFTSAVKDVDPQAAANAAKFGDTPVGDYRIPNVPEPVFGNFGDNPYALVSNRKGEKEVKFAPKGTSVNVDTVGEKSAIKALGGQVPKVLDEAREAVILNLDKIQNANRIHLLAADPDILAGFGASQLTGLAGLGARLGFTPAEAVAKTQELLTATAKQTLTASKDLKGSISEKEKPFLEQAASGGLDYTPQAIARLAQLQAAVSHNALMREYNRYNSTLQVPGAEQGANMYPLPSIEHTLPGSDKEFPQRPDGQIQLGAPGTVGGLPPKPTFVEPEGWANLTPAQQKRYKELKGIK